MTGSESVGDSLVVDRLRIYPVKGARGVDVNQMDFDAVGPRYDRRWMVVDPSGTFVSQREDPRLATIEATVSDSALTLRAVGTGTLKVPMGNGPTFTVRVWQSTVDAQAPSTEADRWLSDVLGEERRLVYLPDDVVRETNPRFAPGSRVGFADGYPALVLTNGSLEELARRAPRPIPVERFRPNIVVSPGQPHEEDRWRHFRVGPLEFEGVKLCARCKVTTVDQIVGTLDDQSEPLRTLGGYRRIERMVYFGVNVVHKGPGRISTGDPLTVLERGTIPAF